jgi:hypothetical protein
MERGKATDFLSSTAYESSTTRSSISSTSSYDGNFLSQLHSSTIASVVPESEINSIQPSLASSFSVVVTSTVYNFSLQLKGDLADLYELFHNNSSEDDVSPDDESDDAVYDDPDADTETFSWEIGPTTMVALLVFMGVFLLFCACCIIRKCLVSVEVRNLMFKDLRLVLRCDGQGFRFRPLGLFRLLSLWVYHGLTNYRGPPILFTVPSRRSYSSVRRRTAANVQILEGIGANPVLLPAPSYPVDLPHGSPDAVVRRERDAAITAAVTKAVAADLAERQVKHGSSSRRSKRRAPVPPCVPPPAAPVYVPSPALPSAAPVRTVTLLEATTEPGPAIYARLHPERVIHPVLASQSSISSSGTQFFTPVSSRTGSVQNLNSDVKSPLLSRDSGSTRSAPPSPRRKKTLVGLSYSVIPEVISCPGPSGLCPLIDSHQSTTSSCATLVEEEPLEGLQSLEIMAAELSANPHLQATGYSADQSANVSVARAGTDSSPLDQRDPVVDRPRRVRRKPDYYGFS